MPPWSTLKHTFSLALDSVCWILHSSGVVARLVAMLESSDELDVSLLLLLLLLSQLLLSSASRMHSCTAILSTLAPQMEATNPSAMLTLIGSDASAMSAIDLGCKLVTERRVSCSARSKPR